MRERRPSPSCAVHALDPTLWVRAASLFQLYEDRPNSEEQRTSVYKRPRCFSAWFDKSDARPMRGSLDDSVNFEITWFVRECQGLRWPPKEFAFIQGMVVFRIRAASRTRPSSGNCLVLGVPVFARNDLACAVACRSMHHLRCRAHRASCACRLRLLDVARPYLLPLLLVTNSTASQPAGLLSVCRRMHHRRLTHAAALHVRSSNVLPTLRSTNLLLVMVVQPTL